MSENKLSLRELIEQNIETLPTNSNDSSHTLVKRYRFQDNRAETLEELDYIIFVMYSLCDIPKIIKNSGKPDWAQKKISFDAVGIPRNMDQIGDVSQVSIGVRLKEDVVHVVVNYKFDIGKDLTYISELQIG